MSGELATHTPPWPTAMPDGMFSPSAKTVILSNRPSPCVDSSTLIRSLPAPASNAAGIRYALGDPDSTAIVEGHRHGIHDIKLGGDQFDGKALRAAIFSSWPRRAKVGSSGSGHTESPSRPPLLAVTAGRRKLSPRQKPPSASIETSFSTLPKTNEKSNGASSCASSDYGHGRAAKQVIYRQSLRIVDKSIFTAIIGRQPAVDRTRNL